MPYALRVGGVALIYSTYQLVIVGQTTLLPSVQPQI